MRWINKFYCSKCSLNVRVELDFGIFLVLNVLLPKLKPTWNNFPSIFRLSNSITTNLIIFCKINHLLSTRTAIDTIKTIYFGRSGKIILWEIAPGLSVAKVRHGQLWDKYLVNVLLSLKHYLDYSYIHKFFLSNRRSRMGHEINSDNLESQALLHNTRTFQVFIDSKTLFDVI